MTGQCWRRRTWVWQAVETLGVSAFAADLVVVEGGPGRAAADPQVLVALWLSATSQAVVHARELNRLCTEHLAYLWLCGGVSMNYHTLSSFRVQQATALEDLFVQLLGRLRAADLVAFQHVAQDGLRVRASAGAAPVRPPRARGGAYDGRAASRRSQASAQRRQLSAQTRQCSMPMPCACRSHSAPQARHAAMHAWS